MKLTRWETFTAYIAKWIVVNIACRINATAVLSLSVETVSLYFNEQNLDKRKNDMKKPFDTV